jgi:pimeloyl-ACP methyl ester carboxylesterase
MTARWHYRESGNGPVLILLHGIGMSHTAWNAVIPHLSSARRVIAFDIPGFGSTPPLPDCTPPTIANLVDSLENSLHDIGIEPPVDFSGNSLGGCMALEAARRGIARSVVAISPTGLWREREPAHVQYVFGVLRFMATHFPRLLKSAVDVSFLRELLLAIPVSPGSRRMPARDALRAIDDLATSTAFEATFENTRTPFEGAGFQVPVTVVFGNRDWILTSSAQRRGNLPSHTRWVEKRGWGHVPMWIDPVGVSRLILGEKCFGADPSPEGRGWPEGPGVGCKDSSLHPSPGASHHPLPSGEGFDTV